MRAGVRDHRRAHLLSRRRRAGADRRVERAPCPPRRVPGRLPRPGRRARVQAQEARQRRQALLNPSVVIDGRVVGIWRRTLARYSVSIALDPFGKVTRAQRRAIAVAAARYASFLGLQLAVALAAQR
jgi:hypothetical protein